MITTIAIRRVIELCWTVDTTFSPDTYEGKDAAWGQSAPTAYLLMHLYPKARLMTGQVQGRPHYWVRYAGYDIDYTWRQFPAGTETSAIRPWKIEKMTGDEQGMNRCKLLQSLFYDRLIHSIVQTHSDQ